MNLVYKIGLATAAIAATLAIACTLPGLSEPEPTRRPTYTPYPTYTPAPAGPTKIPLYSTLAPTVDPNAFKEMAGQEWLFGSAWTEFENGRTLMNNGDYQGAIAAFSRAQVHHGEPSVTLENWTGLAFQGLNDHRQAINHLTKAIEIEDSATNRINRATSYFETERCDLAINDANQALGMTPEYGDGFHTDERAHTILGGCHIAVGDVIRGVVHLQTALELAEEHGYADDEIVAIYVAIGEGQYSNAQYTEAIGHYSKAIALTDTAEARVGRASAYWSIEDCTTAIADSHQALALSPVRWPQYHTDAEANTMLAICYYRRGELQPALQYADAAKQIMREHGYAAEDIEALEMIEEEIRLAMTP